MERRKNTRYSAGIVFADSNAKPSGKSVNLSGREARRRKTSCQRLLPPSLSRQRTSIYSGRMCHRIEISGDVAECEEPQISRLFGFSIRQTCLSSNQLRAMMCRILYVFIELKIFSYLRKYYIIVLTPVIKNRLNCKKT